MQCVGPVVTYESADAAMQSPAARCPTQDPIGGRCQLTIDHEGDHAVYLDGWTSMTWRRKQSQYIWAYPRPAWLIELPWASGFRPEATA